MSGYTRLTVQGGQRKCDVVVPDDEPVAALVPELVTLLEEDRGDGGRPVVLATLLGEQLEPSSTLSELGVLQGTLLRLVRVDRAPAPPEVADVTDLAADALAERADRWRPGWTVTAAASIAAVGGWVAARTAVEAYAAPSGPVLAAVLVLVLVAAALGRTGQVRAALPATAAAAGAALAVAPSLAGGLAVAPAGRLVVGAGLVCATAAVTALGAGRRDVLLGAGTGLALVATWVLLARSSMGASATTAVVAVLGTFGLGVLPGIAMTVSGLNGLDDRVVAGHRPARAVAAQAVATTHRALVWATVAAAALTATAGVELARTGGAPALALATAVAVVLALRTRVLPLAPGRLSLLAAATAIVATLLLDLGRTAPGPAVGLLAGGVLLAALTAGAPPNAHLQARARRLADVVELLAVLATVPLLLVQLGVLRDLLGAF